MNRSITLAVLTLALMTVMPKLRGQSSLPLLSCAVGWWPGDGDTSDRLGVHNGTFVGPVGYGSGMVGSAFSFDGISSHLSVPDAPDLRMAAQMTVEAWIKPFGHGYADPVVKKSDFNQADGFALEFSGSSPDVIMFWVYVGGWHACTGSAIPNNQWSHVAGTFDGQQIRVYVNGQQIGSAGANGSISPASAPLFVGSDPSNPSRHFYGLIDEATVYSTALSADDIRSIYLAGSAGKGSIFRVITPEIISAQTNASLSFQLQATGGMPPYHWSVSESRLPNGVTLSASGVLQGTPTETGEFRFGATVTDTTNGAASGYATLRIPIPAIPYPAPSGIVAWWPFDDPGESTTLEDRVGGNTAAKANAPASTPGKVGQALHFNGVDQYVAIQNTPVFQFGTNDFSIDMWARFDTAGGGSMGEPSHILVGSSDGPGSVNKWFFALGGGVLYFHVNGSGGFAFYPLGSFSPTVGQWYHVAVVRAGKTLTSYVDGIANGFAVDVINIPITMAPVTIGKAEFIGLFNGAIDEPTVYCRALRAEDIQAIFNAGSAGKTVEMTIKPACGGVGGSVTVHIDGVGFKQGATVQLRKAGETSLLGSPVTVGADGSTIDTTFDLLGTTSGAWDVVVTNPDSNTFTLPQAFTLQQSTAAQVWVDIVGLGYLGGGRPQTFHIFYGNRGNVDAVCVPLWIAGIPANASVTLGFEITPPPVLPGESATNYAEVPIQLNAGQEIAIPLLISRIPAGSSFAIAISVTVPQATHFTMRAWANPPFFGSPLHDDVLDCVICAMGVAGNLFLGQDCMGQARQFVITMFTFIADRSRGKNATGQEVSSLTQLLLKIVRVAATCAPGLVDEEVAVVVRMASMLMGVSNAGQCGFSCTTAFLQLLPIVFPVQPVYSYDPNDQAGPQGVGPLRYLSGREPLRYVISFENEAAATAPAQEVRVRNEFDPYKVDIRSLSMGEIRFGTNRVVVPSGEASFSTVVDLRTNQNLLVAVDCGLDPNSSTLNWHFRSLDPITMQPPDDPRVGFLPPNIAPPAGEGSVSFSVSARDSIATGTVVTNFASITFDYNPAINTPVWTNVFDFTAPTIQVQPVQPLQVNNRFELKWGSSDTGSGVDKIKVELSTNNLQFTTYLETTSIVSTVITGRINSAYWMKVTAWDVVGHSNQTVVATDNSLLATKFVSLGTNYMTWAHQYFGATADDLSRESDVWGLFATPAGVGSPNFLKWYYGQSPFLPDSLSNRVSVNLQGSVPVFGMTLRTNEPGAVLDVMWTPDFAQPWSVLPIPAGAVVHPIDATYERVTWPCSLQSTNQGFYRLRLSLNPE